MLLSVRLLACVKAAGFQSLYADESAEFHHDEPDCMRSAAYLDTVARVSSSGTRSDWPAWRGAGDHCLSGLYSRQHYRRTGWLPGAAAWADNDDGDAARS